MKAPIPDLPSRIWPFIDRTDICDGWIINGLYKGGIAEQAGIEIGDIIIAINDRPVKEINLGRTAKRVRSQRQDRIHDKEKKR